jgi:hypothetical protein
MREEPQSQPHLEKSASINLDELATKVATATVTAIAPFLARAADQQPSASAPSRDPSTSTAQPLPEHQLPLSGNTLLDTPGVASHNLPQVPIVNTKMKRDILAGKNVNMASLLSPHISDQAGRELVVGEVSIALKSQDQRLQRNLSIQEFIQAFNIYKSVMCEIYPNRRQELDTYLTTIITMTSQFPGPGFYEYHKQFAARASQFLEQGVKVDWAIRDEYLFVTIFTGKRAQQCAVCGGGSHSSGFCPMHTTELNARQKEMKPTHGADIRGRRVLHMNGKQICNNYNGQRGCTSPLCQRLHVCLECKKPHPVKQCHASSPLK